MCPTPRFRFPKELQTALKASNFHIQRSKRQVMEPPHDALTSRGHLAAETGKRRLRRQTPGSRPINDVLDADFAFGFKMDGNKKYRTFSEDSGVKLDVYSDPLIMDDVVLVYRPFWPFSDDTIQLEVRYVSDLEV